MRYEIIATGQIIPANELQEHYPNISFAPVLDAGILEFLGLIEVEDAPVDPTPVDMQAAITDAMTALFDATAQSKHYDNRITCTMRVGYPGPFQAEGIAFATWMDACNALAYTMLADVVAGNAQMPGSIAEALALLPTMVWPA